MSGRDPEGGAMTKAVEVGKKIRELREAQNMSLQDLADNTGYSSALLSQFENHMVSPPLGALVKLARVLGINVSDFFGESREQTPYVLVRREGHEVVSSVSSREGVNLGYRYEALGFGMSDHKMEPFIIILEPVPIREKHLSVHEGEEFIYVLEGRMKVQLGEETEVLEPGDSVYFKCKIPHHVTCEGNDPAKILAVMYTGMKE
jgi:transcriptional regulator with XRE-family HTH domain